MSLAIRTAAQRTRIRAGVSPSSRRSQGKAMADEVELKLTVAPERAAAVRQLPLLRELAEKRALTRQLETVYYDTPDRALARRGVVLRVRSIGRRRVQTI